jgi:predicted GTPase
VLENILKYRSVSVVGIAKNTGKTETLNYILSKLQEVGKRVAVTSIGLDGEQIDQVFGTQKPEITIYEGMIFATVEKFFKQKTFDAKILQISNLDTVLGKIVIAQAQTRGKVILSGATNTETLKKLIAQFSDFGAEITMIDGATSRLSLASPAVTEAMILATGAAYSPDIEQLTRKTKFVCSMISLETVEENIKNILLKINSGLWCIDNKMQVIDLQTKSSLLLKKPNENIENCKTIFCSGAISDKLLNFLMLHRNVKNFTLIAKDFTKLFFSLQIYNIFTKKGGKILVLHRTNLIAVTVNPTSPQGIILNSQKLQTALKEQISTPVFNVREI